MVVLNNRGAKLLSNRQDERDVLVGGKCFHAALHILKRHLKRQQTAVILPMPPSTRNTEGVYESLEITTSPLIRQQRNEQRRGGARGEAQRLLQCSSHTNRSAKLSSRLGLSRYYVYTRPFKLSRTMALPQEFPKSRLVTAIMTFNLALSHHLMGYTNTPEKERKNWCAALQLYRIAKALRHKAATTTTKHAQDERPLRALGIMLDLAIDNNAAVLHSELGDKRRSLGYFRSLAGCVQQLGVEHQRHADLQGFISNIILLGTISDNAATAA